MGLFIMCERKCMCSTHFLHLFINFKLLAQNRSGILRMYYQGDGTECAQKSQSTWYCDAQTRVPNDVYHN